jgi:hypothetical protein
MPLRMYPHSVYIICYEKAIGTRGVSRLFSLTLCTQAMDYVNENFGSTRRSWPMQRAGSNPDLQEKPYCSDSVLSLQTFFKY